jgi:hypothetical protein
MKDRKDLVFLLGLSLILVIFWVMFSIYHNLNASTIDQPVTIDVNPIKANFNEEVVSTLKKRQKISPLYTVENQTASPSPASSASASPSTQTSSQSAQNSL